MSEAFKRKCLGSLALLACSLCLPTARADVVIGPTDSVSNAVVAARTDANHRVVLKPGRYFLPTGLKLTSADSGLAITAQTTGTVTLIGGTVITGWQQANGTWRAPRPQGMVTSQLFENGVRMAWAKYPATGYNLTRAGGPTPRSSFIVNPGDIAAGVDLTDARVFAWPSHDWFSVDQPIVSYNPSSMTLTTVGSGDYDYQPCNRYFIYNSLSYLNSPGEAVIGSSLFTLRPSGASPGEIIASTASPLIQFDGAQNVHITGIVLSISEGHTVEMIDGASGCWVMYCRVENSGKDGVHVGPQATSNTIEHCEIRETGAMGVSLSGPGLETGMSCSGNLVDDCHIHDGGQRQGHGYGVEVLFSGLNHITHNHIHGFPRYGVSMNGNRPPDNVDRYAYSPTRNNLVAYNDIHDVNKDSQDTGGIESWEPGRDNVIDHNRIHDSGNTFENLQTGIYLDDASNYFTVTNNIIYGIHGSQDGQPIFAKGIYNDIENNILVVDPTAAAGIRSYEMANEPVRQHTYRHNIVAFDPIPANQPVPPGRWGTAVQNIGSVGKTLTWHISVPTSGNYVVWPYYAAQDQPFYGFNNMGGRTSISVDGGAPVPLANLPDTADFNTYGFSHVSTTDPTLVPSATLSLAAGNHTLVWRNDQGGGINWDAFVLSADPAYVPRTEDAPNAITIQAETASELNAPSNKRNVWYFQNWSDDRLALCDYNLLYSPDGQISVFGNPGTQDWTGWRQVLGGIFDAHSLITDPLFVNFAQRDLRLSANSPAPSLGFQPIDATTIGLTPSYPAWLQ